MAEEQKAETTSWSNVATSFVRGLLDALDSPGGHVLVCLALLVLYSAYVKSDSSHDIIIFATGVLARSMGSARQT